MTPLGLPVIYSGPAVPVAYDPNWQLFTNLTEDQIAWFQAQPEWKNFVAWVALDRPNSKINAYVSETTIATELTAANIALVANVSGA